MYNNLSKYFNSKEFYDIIYQFYSTSTQINTNELLNFITSLNIKLFLATKNIKIIHEFNLHLLTYYYENYQHLCFIEYNLDKDINDLLDKIFLKWINTTNKQKILKHLYNTIFKYDWKFHAFNSCFLKSIKKHGINPKIKFTPQSEINEIDNIFQKYGINSILGYQKINCQNQIFFSTSPNVSYYYGINSPEWFAHFINGGQNTNQENPFNTRNYKEAYKKLITLMYQHNFNKSDKQKTKSFFQKYWDLYANNTKPKLIIIKEKNNKQLKDLKKAINNNKN